MHEWAIFNKYIFPWFDGNLQKMASVGASMATAYFTSFWGEGMPMFDARLFTIPDHIEVENYFIWRQQDAVRNSILMLGQHYYSPMQMHGKNCAVVQDMIHDKGDNWNDHPARFKRGGLVFYNRGTIPYPSWEIHSECPTFTSEDGRPFLKSLIPIHWAESAAIPPAVALLARCPECGSYDRESCARPYHICLNLWHKPPVQDHGPRVDTRSDLGLERCPSCGSAQPAVRECPMMCPPANWKWVTDERCSPTDKIVCNDPFHAAASQEAGRGTEEK